MHILLIHQAFAALDEPGGTRHHEFARHLAAQGHHVTVIASPVSYLTGGKGSASPASDGETENTNITIKRVRTYSALHRSFVHRVLAFFSFMVSSFLAGLSVHQVDLVWGTSPPIFQGFTAWLLARLKRVPFVFEVRDLWPQFAIAVGVLKDPLLIKLSRWLERFLYRRARRVIVNSPGYVLPVTQAGAAVVELIPNGADPQMFNPAEDGLKFRSEHHLEEQFVVLYAGAHGMSNDLGVALEAARILQENPACAQVRLVLLGDGKEKPSLQEQAARMGLSNVLFVPPVAKEGIPVALAGADACLAILKPLDEYKTTYPNKVFDYMAAGRPVVLAIDGVIREVVEAAGCGVFARPGDPGALAAAIQRLASNPAHSREMGLAGRKYLEMHFDRQESAQRLMDIFCEEARSGAGSGHRKK